MKYALITSSTKGIGLATGINLLSQGYFVFFNYYNDELNANKVDRDLKNSHFYNYKIIKANMTSFDGIEILYNEVLPSTELDCIILNTGITCRDNFENITIEEWNKVMNANLNIPFFLLQKFNSQIKDNGRIIFIGSMLGTVPHAISIPYGVSKASVNMLCKSLVKVFKSRRITVNVISPGFVDTDWQKVKPKEHQQRVKDKIALNRFADLNEISSTIIHTIENGYINGAIIDVNGGYGME